MLSLRRFDERLRPARRRANQPSRGGALAWNSEGGSSGAEFGCRRSAGGASAASRRASSGGAAALRSRLPGAPPFAPGCFGHAASRPRPCRLDPLRPPLTIAPASAPRRRWIRNGAKVSLRPRPSRSIRTCAGRPIWRSRKRAMACGRPRAGGRRAPGARASAPAACALPACRAAPSTERRAGGSIPLRRSAPESARTSPRSRSGTRRSGRRRTRCPGRSARSRAHRRTTSARLCRRFMRFRIRSSPA